MKQKLLNVISLFDKKEAECGLSNDEIQLRGSKKRELQDLVFKEEIF